MWKFQQIRPQPARGKLVKSMWTDPNWIAEEKYDGDRRIAQFCGKVVRFTGRRISVKDGLFVEKTYNVPHLSAAMFTNTAGSPAPMDVLAVKDRRHWVAPPAALDGTVLDGEMIATQNGKTLGDLLGGMSKYVTSIMGSLPEEAVQKQIERGWLRYVVFDCLYYKGEDIRLFTLDRRRQMAINAVEDWGNPFVSFAESSGYGKASGAENKREIYDSIVKRGGEGVILKFIHGQYGDRQAWVKVKKTSTADVVIMGFVPAKEMSKKKGDDKATLTKFAKLGLIGAIQCGQYPDPGNRAMGKLVEVATVSGMDDTLRMTLSGKSAKSYVGRVVTIEHNGREPTGRFRHPRLAHPSDPFRDDKKAIDCVMYEGEV